MEKKDETGAPAIIAGNHSVKHENHNSTERKKQTIFERLDSGSRFAVWILKTQKQLSILVVQAIRCLNATP